jgi:hypothetical protein
MIAEEAEHSGGDFLKRHRTPVIIDELQYAPTLLRHVKDDIDRHRDETGASRTRGADGSFTSIATTRVARSISSRAAELGADLSVEAGNTRQLVEMPIEAHEVFDAVLSQHRRVDGVPYAQVRVAEHDLSRRRHGA